MRRGLKIIVLGGYIHLATLTLNRAYINYPICIEIAQRTTLIPTRIYIMFNSSATKDPDLSTTNFRVSNNNLNIFICKSDTSIWNLYVKTTAWYGIDIIDIKIPGTIKNNVDIVFSNIFLTTLPDDAFAARVVDE